MIPTDQTVEEMRTELSALHDERQALHDAAGDNALDETQAARWAELDATEQRLNTQIAETEQAEARARTEAAEEEQRQAQIAESRTRWAATRRIGGAIVNEPEVYRRGGNVSYFRDLFRAQHGGNRDSIERLVRNDRQVADTPEMRALSTVDGAGGDFVPPMWMVHQYVELARAARVVANRLRSQPLPPGTDSIPLPRLASGTEVDEQATENTEVKDTSATTDSVTAKVATIAGMQVISQQLLDQSPINMDEILLGDLAADYAVKLDRFVISNNAAQKRGIRNVPGIHAITYTDTTPTAAELNSKIGDAIQRVHTSRFLPVDHVFMTPRRWQWLLTAVDANGRPLAVPVAQSPQNVLAAVGDVTSEGFVGSIQGVPVFVDPNIPTNLGAATNEDILIVMRASDVILYEGSPRSETFRETKAEELSVLLRFYNYAMIHSERFPKSIAVISGTGLVAPAF